ncbi:hypothetical protein NDU88_001407 [Pleurodeles waltl]|uniref:Uncharacterized protein n=1 Tax=Pleurodeles waltl TaxID=8319 RepID=A0AAV7S8I8_PLEWA|nr:hypothetical protein NDU88_001407 [Pleurodeles waltl]
MRPRHFPQGSSAGCVIPTERGEHNKLATRRRTHRCHSATRGFQDGAASTLEAQMRWGEVYRGTLTVASQLLSLEAKELTVRGAPRPGDSGKGRASVPIGLGEPCLLSQPSPVEKE